MKLFIDSEQSMLSLAADIAKICSDSCRIYLQGDLGAGKTTFCRGFIQACGHHGKVKSPTYTMVEPYQLADKLIYHFDLYRVVSADELEFIGLADYFAKGAICLVEWPQNAHSVLPIADLMMTIRCLENGRELEMVAHTVTGERLLTEIKKVKKD